MANTVHEQPLTDLSADLAGYCRRWSIRALEVFGSASRGELRPDSDLDFLVTFHPEADWSLFDHVRMKHELEALTGRRVDLLTRRALEHSRNWLLRAEILDSARTVFSEEEPGVASG